MCVCVCARTGVRVRAHSHSRRGKLLLARASWGKGVRDDSDCTWSRLRVGGELSVDDQEELGYLQDICGARKRG